MRVIFQRVTYLLGNFFINTYYASLTNDWGLKLGIFLTLAIYITRCQINVFFEKHAVRFFFGMTIFVTQQSNKPNNCHSILFPIYGCRLFGIITRTSGVGWVKLPFRIIWKYVEMCVAERFFLDIFVSVLCLSVFWKSLKEIWLRYTFKEFF